MINRYILRFILFISLFVPIVSFAHIYNDDYVARWAQGVLIDTFDASYLDTPAQIEAVHKKYSHSAWVPMRNFFSQELHIMKEHHLNLHPRPITDPVIVEKGDYLGVSSWRVQQTLTIPELHMDVECSVLIIKIHSADEPFLIQSVDMKVHQH